MSTASSGHEAAAFLAVSMVVFGVLVIVFPELVAWILGLFLIATGVVLIAMWFDARRHSAHYETASTDYPAGPPQ